MTHEEASKKSDDLINQYHEVVDEVVSIMKLFDLDKLSLTNKQLKKLTKIVKRNDEILDVIDNLEREREVREVVRLTKSR